jgi:hypothetical protein
MPPAEDDDSSAEGETAASGDVAAAFDREAGEELDIVIVVGRADVVVGSR